MNPLTSEQVEALVEVLFSFSNDELAEKTMYKAGDDAHSQRMAARLDGQVTAYAVAAITVCHHAGMKENEIDLLVRQLSRIEDKKGVAL